MNIVERQNISIKNGEKQKINNDHIKYFYLLNC